MTPATYSSNTISPTYPLPVWVLPAWVLATVALWPLPGIAATLMALGALTAIVLLLITRFRGGSSLLSTPAWALTSVLFAAYWLPQLVAAIDAAGMVNAWVKALTSLRYLPFLWLVAMSVANRRSRRITFSGLGVIVLIWTIDALLEVITGSSPLFWGLDSLKQLISHKSLCPSNEVLAFDRLNGVFSNCNPKLGLVIASLSPFALFMVSKRIGITGWLIVAALVGIVVVLAGSRGSWLTYALVLLLSGWQLMGWKRLLVVGSVALLGFALLGVFSPLVQERIARTTQAITAEHNDIDTALSGRIRIWEAAACMVVEHPINGVGTRGFRDKFAECDPDPGIQAVWGDGPALHAHQIILEILSETGIIGLLLWLSGAAMAWRAWRYSSLSARERTRPAMLALVVTVFPLNTHLAFYSSFWGSVTLTLVALYAGSLLATDKGIKPVEGS